MNVLTQKKQWYISLVIFFSTLSCSLFAGGSFKGITEVEGSEFEVGEEFVVSYKLAAKGSYSLSNPQFSLDGAKFNGLEVIRQGQDRSFSFGFGDNAVFTYKYVLKGNKPGNYTVPAITINMNGKSYPTQSKKISIVKKSKDKISIVNEGEIHKAVKNVKEITFSPINHNKRKDEIKIITERCIFMIDNGKVILKNVFPGIDIKKDILDQMEFMPQIDLPN